MLIFWYIFSLRQNFFFEKSRDETRSRRSRLAFFRDETISLPALINSRFFLHFKKGFFLRLKGVSTEDGGAAEEEKKSAEEYESGVQGGDTEKEPGGEIEDDDEDDEVMLPPEAEGDSSPSQKLKVFKLNFLLVGRSNKGNIRFAGRRCPSSRPPQQWAPNRRRRRRTGQKMCHNVSLFDTK